MTASHLHGQSILITGGTGSFGQALTRELLKTTAARIAIFSRDELKQHEMRTHGFHDPRLRWFIGDVRDRDRLTRAAAGIDVIVHAAAMKQVPTCEYNPLEAKKTNVDGAANVIEAAIDANVQRVLALGTDKAVDPTNLYGATKLIAEKLFVDANAYSGADGPRFSCTRYGNVISSRGSVLPLFQSLHAAGLPLTVTDPNMTRFVLTIDQGVGFVLDCLGRMVGCEVFVPKLPAATVATIAHAAAWPDEPDIIVTGIRPGEKRHELLVSPNEADSTLDCGSHYLVTPVTAFQPDQQWDGEPVGAGFRYRSDTAPALGVREFRELAGLDRARREAAITQ